MPGPNDHFPLVDLIRGLGEQLRQAQHLAHEDEEETLLELKECTVEVGVGWEPAGAPVAPATGTRKRLPRAEI